MTGPRMSLVVVTWNSSDVLGDLLDSLVADPPSTPFEVLVVDNGSQDATLLRAGSHPLGAKVIANDTNLGLAAANNVGIAAAAGEFVIICNPDIVPLPGALDALVAAADRHPRAGFVLARLQHEDGTLQSGVGDLPRLKEVLLGRRAARVRASTSGFWWDGWPHDEERTVGHGQEACYLVRQRAIAEVGPQDPGYWLDWEGFDWAARMWDGGWEVWFTPDAAVTHLGSTSLSRVKARSTYWSHRGMYRYFAHRGPRWRRPLLAIAFGARGVAKMALLVRPDVFQRALRVDT